MKNKIQNDVGFDRSHKYTVDNRRNIEDTFSEEFRLENVQSMVISDTIGAQNNLLPDKNNETIQLDNPLVIILLNSKHQPTELTKSKSMTELMNDIKDVSVKDMISEFIDDLVEKTYDLVKSYSENPENSTFTVFLKNLISKNNMQILSCLLDKGINSSINKVKPTLNVLSSLKNQKSLQSIVSGTPTSMKRPSDIFGVLKISSTKYWTTGIKSTLSNCRAKNSNSSDTKEVISKFYQYHFRKLYGDKHTEWK